MEEKKWHDDVLVEKRDKNEKSMYRYNNKRPLLNANSFIIDSLYISELLQFSKTNFYLTKGGKVHNNVNRKCFGKKIHLYVWEIHSTQVPKSTLTEDSL